MKREILKQSWSEKGILHSPENSCLYQFEGRDAKQRQKLTKYNEVHYLGTIFLIDQDSFGFLCTRVFNIFSTGTYAYMLIL